ncbi:hypothetical protein NF552_22670 (plasmid) [Roseomonas mucosa]|nr:hypothetical protein NF552_22670 [Roseomonas mucosa]
MQVTSETGAPRKRSLNRWVAAGSIVLLLLLVAAWALPQWALHTALDRVNETGRTFTIDDIRRASLAEASTALAGIDRGDLLFRASADDLRKMLADALAVAAASRMVPVNLTGVSLSPDRQAIEVTADVSGTLDGGIKINGRIHGAVVPSFQGRDLVLRTAFDRIDLRSIEVPGWHWLPGSIVRLLNPAIREAIAKINGAIPVNRQVFLPAPTEARRVQVGSQEVVIPALAPATPATMIDGGGLHVLAQILAQDPARPPGPAGGNTSFDVFRSAFAAKAEVSHPGFVALPLGAHLSDAFLDRLLGDLRVVGTTEDLARGSVRTAARGLNLITGPDIVLRIPGEQAVQLIGGAVADALSKASLPVTVVGPVRPSLQAGAVVVDADVRAEIPISPIVNATTTLAIRIVAVAEGSREGDSGIRILPRVAWVRMVSIKMAAPGEAPFGEVGPVFNAFLQSLVTTVNSLLPAVPVPLPAASSDPVDIAPIIVAGGSVAVSPPASSLLPTASTALSWPPRRPACGSSRTPRFPAPRCPRPPLNVCRTRTRRMPLG